MYLTEINSTYQNAQNILGARTNLLACNICRLLVPLLKALQAYALRDGTIEVKLLTVYTAW
jgi:hypothetical protein